LVWPKSWLESQEQWHPAVRTKLPKGATGGDKLFFNPESIDIFRKHERTGSPIGNNGFIEKMEK